MYFKSELQTREETICVDEGKIINVSFKNNSFDNQSHNSSRGGKAFQYNTNYCMRLLMEDNLEVFKEMLKSIKEDTKYYNYGIELMRKEAEKYKL